MLKSLITSNIFYFIKAIFAFLLTTYLANTLAPADFVLWSVLLSFSLFFTLSDLGAGQYLLRSYVKARRDPQMVRERVESLAGQYVVLFMCVATLFLLLLFLVIRLQLVPKFESVNIVFLLSFYGVVLGRNFFIPFVSLLSANDFYHIRKILEAFIYIAVFLTIILLKWAGGSLQTLIMSHSVCFFLGSAVSLIICRNKGWFAKFRFSFSIRSAKNIFLGSWPYFLNNLCTLVTRGGLVFFAGFLLDDNDIVQLSIYSAVFYQASFQFFEILIRTAQPKIIVEINKYKYFEKILYLLTFLFMFFGVLVGENILFFIYPNVVFSENSWTLFVLLGGLEIIYSIMNAKWQMFEELNRLLICVSVFKAFSYVTFFAVLGMFFENYDFSVLLVGLITLNMLIVAGAFFLQKKIIANIPDLNFE